LGVAGIVAAILWQAWRVDREVLVTLDEIVAYESRRAARRVPA